MKLQIAKTKEDIIETLQSMEDQTESYNEDWITIIPMSYAIIYYLGLVILLRKFAKTIPTARVDRHGNSYCVTARSNKQTSDVSLMGNFSIELTAEILFRNLFSYNWYMRKRIKLDGRQFSHIQPIGKPR